MRSIAAKVTLLSIALISALSLISTVRCRASEPTGEAVAVVDSSTVATFLELPPETIEQRRKQAEQRLKQAEKESNGPVRRQLLRQAVDLDPAGVANWLALADLEFLMGYDVSAEASLAAARVALDLLKGESRKEAIRDYSLAMAWREYRMARWKEGLDWGERALKYDAGMAGHLIVGLNNGKLMTSWNDVQEAGHVFRPRDLGNRRANMSWVYTLHWHFHMNTYSATNIRYYLNRSMKHYEQDVLRWRDFGMFCECHDDDNLAAAYYEQSARAIPVPGGRWLTRRERTLPVLNTPMAPMPFWVNPDGGYVTGSLLAYLGHARDQMVAATDPTEQDVWAERVLAYSGRTVQRYLFYPWPALWRSEALMELEQVQEAAKEVRYARDKFKMEKIEEPALNRVHGRILLMQKKFGQAVPMLRQAVDDFPRNATCWADLGIAEAVVGGPGPAAAAFDRALVLDSGLAAAWYNRGLLKWKHGDRQGALADMEKAAALVPENNEIRADLTKFLQARNR
jgi:hypothetical protein